MASLPKPAGGSSSHPQIPIRQIPKQNQGDDARPTPAENESSLRQTRNSSIESVNTLRAIAEGRDSSNTSVLTEFPEPPKHLEPREDVSPVEHVVSPAPERRWYEKCTIWWGRKLPPGFGLFSRGCPRSAAQCAGHRQDNDRRNDSDKSSDSNDTTYVSAREVPDGQYVDGGIRGVLSSRYVLLCALFSAIGGVLFGYDQGVVSVILVMDQFLDQFPQVSPNAGGYGFWKGLMTAMIELGAFVGALNQGWIADKYSRKRSIMFAVGIFLIGSILQTAAHDFSMLVVARLIGGIGLGMLSMVTPLYISEISPPEIRGTLLVLEELSIVFGIVVAFWITFGTRYMVGEWSWRLPFLLQVAPALVLGAGIAFLPYSPRWLVSKRRDDEALESLAKLRNLKRDHYKVQQEWTEIRAEVRCHQEICTERHPNLQDGTAMSKIKLEIASWIDCFRPGCYKRTHVGMGLMFFQQFVGINALIYYSPTLFEGMGLDYQLQLIMSGVLNVCQLIGVASSLFTMDRFGRRRLLLWGCALMFICFIIIAGLVGDFSDDWQHEKGAGWASVTFLLVYMLTFGATWGPVPWAIPSEIFPSSLRAKGVALSTCSNWINNFFIGLITPPLVQNTKWGAYVFFAVFCSIAGVWTFFFVPETNSVSLEQMDAIFGDAANGGAEEDRRTRIRRAIENSDLGDALTLPPGGA